MQILTVDIGTGTQDIFLYDSRVDLENGYKLILPSATMIVRRKVQMATRRGQKILLTGVTMGGGPSHWRLIPFMLPQKRRDRSTMTWTLSQEWV